jgi:hypothetical protein
MACPCELSIIVEHPNISSLVREVCELLDRQVTVLRENKISDLSERELQEYEKRKARIAELRAELGKTAKPM